MYIVTIIIFLQEIEKKLNRYHNTIDYGAFLNILTFTLNSSCLKHRQVIWNNIAFFYNIWWKCSILCCTRKEWKRYTSPEKRENVIKIAIAKGVAHKQQIHIRSLLIYIVFMFIAWIIIFLLNNKRNEVLLQKYCYLSIYFFRSSS